MIRTSGKTAYSDNLRMILVSCYEEKRILRRNLFNNLVYFCDERTCQIDVVDSGVGKILVYLFRNAVCTDNDICVRRNRPEVVLYVYTLPFQVVVDDVVVN